MTEHNHRLGVSEVNLVKRHLRLSLENEQEIKAAIDELDNLYGMDSLSFDAAGGVLTAYDATRFSIEDVESILGKHNVQLVDSWWTQMKEDYYKFIDNNVRENAKHEPWSCHSDPNTSRRNN